MISKLRLAATMTSAAWSIIWKWSVPVSRTGPDWTVTKIGNALFPGLALPISHVVTLRWSKAPITVCESVYPTSLARKPFLHFPGNALSDASDHGTLPTGTETSNEWIFRMVADTGRGMPGRTSAATDPTCRLSGSRRRSGCIPAEPYPPLEHSQTKPERAQVQWGGGPCPARSKSVDARLN